MDSTRKPEAPSGGGWALPSRLGTRPALIAVASLLAAGAVACATPEAEPVDVQALALEYEVDADDLRLFLRGYDEGYEDGDNRNAGVFAGSGLGNVPGPEGWGWRQGLEDGVNGRPRRSPEELAPVLRDR